MATTFGQYRGAQTYLMHVARNDEDDIQLPMICKMKFPIAHHYSEFLARKVQDGFKSETLLLGVNNVPGWTRDQRTDTYRILRHRLMDILDSFKQFIRLRSAMRKIRQRRRAQRIHEELVSIVWSPAAIQKRLDMGLTLDEVLEL